MSPGCFSSHVLCEDVCAVIIAADLYGCHGVGLYELLDEVVLDGDLLCFLLAGDACCNGFSR